jgi:hypothetical protein
MEKMKKIILSAIVVCAFTFTNAQDKKGMAFGVKAGLSNSNFTGDLATTATIGFYVGGLVDFSLSEKLHLQPEVLYSAEGAKDAKLNFLRIPIMGKYYITEAFNVQAGPEIAIKAGGDAGIKDTVKSLDYGIGFGAGYEMKSGLLFDARYNLGLANIYDGPVSKVGTTSIQLGLGYRF